MPERIIVSWNNNGRINEALDLFYKMRDVGVLPTRVSVVRLLSASAELEAVNGGKQGHAVVLRGLKIYVILDSSMINFYCKVGLVEAGV